MLYHGCWDLVNLFGIQADWYYGLPGHLWQQSICWVFILLSGFCVQLGHHTLRRGAQVFGAGALVTAVTLLFMPEDRVVFGVLTLLGSAMLLTGLLEKQLREVNKKLDNLMKAIEDGLYTRTTKERLEALESQKDELTVKIADEKLKKPSFNEDFIRFWLMKFRKFDISQKKQRKALIEIFVNAIFLYDDRMLITFNYKDGTKTVRFEDTLTADSAEEKSSDLFSSAGP